MDSCTRQASGSSYNRYRSGSGYSSTNGFLDTGTTPMTRGGSLNSSSNTTYSTDSRFSFDDDLQYASSFTTASHNNSPSAAIREDEVWPQPTRSNPYTAEMFIYPSPSTATSYTSPFCQTWSSPYFEPAGIYSTSPSQMVSSDQEIIIASTFPPYDPAEGNPNIHWQMYYNQKVDKAESYWELKKGYKASAKFPVKRVDKKEFRIVGLAYLDSLSSKEYANQIIEGRKSKCFLAHCLAATQVLLNAPGI
jgi:hypothetical protein